MSGSPRGHEGGGFLPRLAVWLAVSNLAPIVLAVALLSDCRHEECHGGIMCHTSADEIRKGFLKGTKLGDSESGKKSVHRVSFRNFTD